MFCTTPIQLPYHVLPSANLPFSTTNCYRAHRSCITDYHLSFLYTCRLLSVPSSSFPIRASFNVLWNICSPWMVRTMSQWSHPWFAGRISTIHTYINIHSTDPVSASTAINRWDTCSIPGQIMWLLLKKWHWVRLLFWYFPFLLSTPPLLHTHLPKL